MLPPLGTTGVERSYGSSFDFEQMIQSLRELFEQDRQTASQSDSTRCGICYLYYPVSELQYRDEGFYLCKGCEQALGKHTLPMLRHQQKLG
jgi:Pyruvate/2-oxoacid:ferredoxin oxidoreductase delta subunit